MIIPPPESEFDDSDNDSFVSALDDMSASDSEFDDPDYDTFVSSLEDNVLDAVSGGVPPLAGEAADVGIPTAGTHCLARSLVSTDDYDLLFR